jgi:hypothetical protein
LYFGLGEVETTLANDFETFDEQVFTLSPHYTLLRINARLRARLKITQMQHRVSGTESA